MKTAGQQCLSPSKKKRPSSEQPWGNALRGMTSTSLTGGSRMSSCDYGTGHNRINVHMNRKMKLAVIPDSNSGFEDEQILQRCALLQTVRMIIMKVFIQR